MDRILAPTETAPTNPSRAAVIGATSRGGASPQGAATPSAASGLTASPAVLGQFADTQTGDAESKGSGAAPEPGRKNEGEGGSSRSPDAGDTSAGFTPERHSDSGGAAAQFRGKGGDNSLQDSGGEAPAAELDQAAAALHGYLDARAAGAWTDACSYMASGVAESLAQFAGNSPQLRGAGCPELLAALSAGMPDYVRKIITQADVGSLRVDGDSGFLLFHGAHNTDYFMPMAREGGRWKVAALAASAIP